MSGIPQLQVFISSPTDVLPEREVAERVIARLDGIWKEHVRLRAERWERHHYEAAKGFQEAIGGTASYDVVLGILWKRIGSPLPPDLFRRSDGSAYESGTVYELETAIAASEAKGKPTVYLYRKTAPVNYAAESVEEDRRQHQALLAWWNSRTRDAQGHYRRGYQEFPTVEAFEQSIESLLEGYLSKSGLIPTGPAWDIKTKGSPYPGLLPYDSAYGAVFFGRALAVASSLEDLKAAAKREAPVLFIVGPSGSGKSSLARAGLTPHFAGTQIVGVDSWRHLLLEPASDPMLTLAQRLYAPGALPELAQGPQSTPERFAALARQSPEGAAQAVKWGIEQAAVMIRQQIGGGRLPVIRLLLTVDQLETVFDSPQHRAIAALVRALAESGTTWVIATLRSDRYPDLQLDPDFLELRRRGALYDLPPPGPSEIADIIKGPARAADLLFEERDGRSLAKAIGSAVSGADALPLLQMTLARLFDERADKTLTFDAYGTMGGLEGAIAAHAEEVFKAVSPGAQQALDALLRALVADIDEEGRLTIRTPDRAAIAEHAGAAELVAKMTEARLLVSADGAVRIAHEALLRRWQRATTSPALQPEAIRLRRQIEPNLEVWRKTRLDADLLQPGTALAAAEAVVSQHPGAFPPEIADYVRRSAEAAEARNLAEKHRAQADARRSRLRAYAAMVAALVLAGLTLLTLRSYGEANRNLVLALLTKADRLLVDEKPAQALVVAGSLSRPGVWHDLLTFLGLADDGNEERVRISTIAEIAGPASAAPIRTIINSSPATAGALSDDGRWYAVGYESGMLVAARTDGSGRPIQLKAHSGRIWSVKFGPGAKWLASQTSREILVWDLERKVAQPICDGRSDVTDIAVDATGRFLAWTTKDGRTSIRSVATAETKSFDDHRRRALATDFSADGSLFASSGDDGAIVVRRTADGSLVKRFNTNRVDLISISFSPDGKRIASASLAGAVDVWPLDADQPETSGTFLIAAPDKRWKVRFSPEGRWLALASWQGTVRFWDANTLRYRGTIDGHDHRVNDIAFTERGSLFLTVTESGVLRLWNLDSLQPMFVMTADDARETLMGKYSPDGTKFVAGGKDGFATLYRVHKGGFLELHCRVKHSGWITGLAFSPDGRRIVSAGTGEGPTEDGEIIKLWDTESCAPIKTPINVAGQFVHALAYSPSGERIAWATRSGEVWLAEFGNSFRHAKLPRVHTAAVDEIDFSSDGKWLVSGGRDARLIVWNVEQKTIERELRGHRQGVYTAKIAPNGKLIASGGTEDRILIWDFTRAKGDELIRELIVRGGSNRLAFNREGSLLAVGSDARYISMWTVHDWRKVFQLNALVGVRSVYDFHPVRGDLAFDGENGLIRILPNRAAPASARASDGALNGMDVSFDSRAPNLPAERDSDTIQGPERACVNVTRH